MKRIALLVCLLVVAQFALAQAGKQLTIESIFAEGGITGRGPETVKWSPDGQKVSFVQRDDAGEHGALYYVDVATGKRAVLVTEEKLASLAPPINNIKDERQKEWMTRYAVAGYQWAPDSKHLLFDSRGQLWLYSLDNGTGVQLTSAGDPSTDPKFSPDGTHLAYLRKHNLFIRPVGGKEEHQLTTGDKDHPDDLFNGEVDWVYAEELAVRSNYFFSPDSKHIVFLQMNEKPVPTYPITDWIPQHPKVDEEKYPKAGDPNPEVRVGVVSTGGGSVKWITVGAAADREYIPRFGWVNPEVIWIQILNRAQNKLELWFADVASGKSHKMLAENEPDAWVPVSDDFKVLKSGDRFLWASWRDGHMHLYLYSFDKTNPLASDAKLERQLTKGDFEVTGVSSVDEDAGLVYFVASVGDPRNRRIFVVPVAGGEMREVPSVSAGTHHPTFASDAKHFVDNASSQMTPPSLSVCPATKGECALIWQARTVTEFNLIAPKMLELKAADGKTTLYASLLMPPNATGKVPVIMNPYGGPGGQVVVNSWGGTNFLFDQILARAGFAILKIDNRGMAGRGKAFQAASRRKFGEVELADQLAALQQVLDANPQLDANRLGWWGWSYGGYMTLYAMTHSDRFKAGISVAPVTDWLDYDSIYTERYMGVPKDNEQGYKNSSPVNAAKNLKGRLLEVHGTSDDNVHVQNTVQMINAFINSGVQFDLQLYPRKTHGISGKAARTHLFHRIQDHFERYLMGAQPATAQSEGK